MLIRFMVENYRSINNPIVLSMVPNKRLDTFENHVFETDSIELLRAAYIYGANAAGKTNIIKAVDFAKSILIDGLKETETYNQHFRHKSENKEKATVFQFDFIQNSMIYSYGFAIKLSNQAIEEEWLSIVSSNGNLRNVFHRDSGSNIQCLIRKNSSEYNRIMTYVEDMKTADPRLFLRELAKKKISSKQSSFFNHVNNAYKWFDNLVIISPDTKIGSLFPVLENKKYGTDFCRIIRGLDTGVDNFSYEETTLEQALRDAPKKIFDELLADINKDLHQSKADAVSLQIGNNHISIELKKDGTLETRKIVCQHKNAKSLFGFNEESDGTNRLFDLVPIMLGDNNHKVYLIDELDRSLHPNLVIEFVKLFYEQTQKNSKQLIVTTHQAELMDMRILRRDEIWIVDRKKDGSSELYSLDAFKVRKDKNTSSAYLQGRYGGIPLFSINDQNCEIEQSSEGSSDNQD